MYYEINVSKDGKHLFATHPRSIKTLEEVRYLLDMFKIIFRPLEGFDMTVTQYLETGITVSFQEIYS